MTDQLPPWGSAVAGATSALLANTLVYPLDVIKTRIQVQSAPLTSETDAQNSPHYYTSTSDAVHKILAADGPSGLYAGLSGSLLGVASQSFAYFYWYSVLRRLSLSRLGSGAASELAVGAAAGALAQIFTIPVAVVTTRQQTAQGGERQSLLATAREVVESEDGWSGLWRGLKASLILVVNPAITYGAYQRLRTRFYPGRANLKAHEAFLLGALSKMVATVVTQPLIVAKVGLQSKPSKAQQGKPFKTFWEVIGHTMKTEGAMGLFKGLRPQLMKAVLVQGLLMMIKERIEMVFIILFAYGRLLQRLSAKEVLKQGRRLADESAEVGRTMKSAADSVLKSSDRVIEKASENVADMLKPAQSTVEDGVRGSGEVLRYIVLVK